MADLKVRPDRSHPVFTRVHCFHLLQEDSLGGDLMSLLFQQNDGDCSI